MSDASAPPTPAGWHPDPQGQADLRYWDGSRWTGHLYNRSQVANGGAAPSAPLPTTGDAQRYWGMFSTWFTRGNGWTTGYVIAAVGAASSLIVGLTVIGAVASAVAQNPCDKLRQTEAQYVTVADMERWEAETNACYDWLDEHPQRLDDYSDLYGGY